MDQMVVAEENLAIKSKDDLQQRGVM